MATGFVLSGSNLLHFDTATPNVVTSRAITGVAVSETIASIDVRPQNGVLYGLGVNAAANTATLYTISTRTGVASAVGIPGSIAFADAAGSPIDLPASGYGFDFNPAADRIRVTAGSLNFRIDPNTGQEIDGNFGGAAGSVANTNPDGPITGAAAQVGAIAYTNNQPNNSNITTLYTLDAASDTLYIQNPPNSGIQTLGVPLSIDIVTVNGFDIVAGVNAPASNAAVTSGTAFANVSFLNGFGDPISRLCSINLVTGVVTPINILANRFTPTADFAVYQNPGGIPAIALSGDGASLIRFNTGSLGTTTTQAISQVAAGETLVGIDYRPGAEQLFGLGVNATTNSATLYRIDPQTGAAAAIGATGSISLTTNGVTPIDLPDPATAGYGFDFNPTVDRIRVTTSTGLDFRINPNTGAAVDGDNGGVAGSGVETNPDGAINGLGVTGVSAAAYINNVGGATATTLYTLDAASNALYIQFPPNGGTQSTKLGLTLNGSPLDFADVGGFDILAGVRAPSSNAPAAGFGYAALTVGGVAGLYRIELLSGNTTNLGTIGNGSPLAGLALGNGIFKPFIVSNGGGDTATVAFFENDISVTNVLAFDVDTQTVVYSISGGVDAARLNINSTTGALTFAARPDFDAPLDSDRDNIYVVRVRATDSALVDDQTITVNVADVNEVPSFIGPASFSVAENSTTVATLSAPDPDAGSTVTYSLVVGDRYRLQIDAATGALSFVTPPDFEAPADGGANNSYAVVVRASDGTLFTEQTVTVNVTNVSEFAPVITSNGGGGTASITVGAGVTAVATVTATDADAATTLAYSIQGGADAARFQISATTGVLTFLAAPNFSTPSANGDNSFDVQVRVSDGTLADTQNLTVVWNPFTANADDVTIGYANGTWDGLGGDDRMIGTSGFDVLIGGTGNDTLFGGANPSGQGDILLGGVGNDLYYVDSGLDLIDEGSIPAFAVFGFGGFDTILSTADFFWDVYSVGETIRVTENVVDAGNDGVTVVGGVFNNKLLGHSGTDVLFGRGGSDTYVAGDGVDYISLSTLGVMDVGSYVANGVNTVVVEQRTTGPNSYDIVYEFESGKDRLDVSDYGFASTAAAFATGVDDGSGNSYFILGDGLDYLYMAGLEMSELNASDFIV